MIRLQNWLDQTLVVNAGLATVAPGAYADLPMPPSAPVLDLSVASPPAPPLTPSPLLVTQTPTPWLYTGMYAGFQYAVVVSVGPGQWAVYPWVPSSPSRPVALGALGALFGLPTPQGGLVQPVPAGCWTNTAGLLPMEPGLPFRVVNRASARVLSQPSAGATAAVWTAAGNTPPAALWWSFQQVVAGGAASPYCVLQTVETGLCLGPNGTLVASPASALPVGALLESGGQQTGSGGVVLVALDGSALFALADWPGSAASSVLQPVVDATVVTFPYPSLATAVSPYVVQGLQLATPAEMTSARQAGKVSCYLPVLGPGCPDGQASCLLVSTATGGALCGGGQGAPLPAELAALQALVTDVCGASAPAGSACRSVAGQPAPSCSGFTAAATGPVCRQACGVPGLTLTCDGAKRAHCAAAPDAGDCACLLANTSDWPVPAEGGRSFRQFACQLQEEDGVDPRTQLRPQCWWPPCVSDGLRTSDMDAPGYCPADFVECNQWLSQVGSGPASSVQVRQIVQHCGLDTSSTFVPVRCGGSSGGGGGSSGAHLVPRPSLPPAAVVGIAAGATCAVSLVGILLAVLL